jgi:hypothetical protein
MDYMVTFCGHIDEHKRPRFIDEAHKIEFPERVYDSMFISTNGTLESLVGEVNKLSKRYPTMNCMTARFDPSAMIDTSAIDVNVMLIPLHMITHITVEIKGPISAGLDDGVDAEGGKGIVRQ